VKMEGSNFESFSSWRQWFFIGVSIDEPASLTLDQGQLQSLFSVTNSAAVLSSGAPIDPRFIINQKGATVWTLLFVLTLMNDKAGLEAVANGKCGLQIPPSSIRDVFRDHVNWPDSILKRYPVGLKSGHFFILPFLRHKDLTAPIPLSRSVKTPGGEIEILVIKEFDDADPESLMRSIHEICSAINTSVES
jgi:hypothetical protein